jgi:hypothetical protein
MAMVWLGRLPVLVEGCSVVIPSMSRVGVEMLEVLALEMMAFGRSGCVID